MSSRYMRSTLASRSSRQRAAEPGSDAARRLRSHLIRARMPSMAKATREPAAKSPQASPKLIDPVATRMSPSAARDSDTQRRHELVGGDHKTIAHGLPRLQAPHDELGGLLPERIGGSPLGTASLTTREPLGEIEVPRRPTHPARRPQGSLHESQNQSDRDGQHDHLEARARQVKREHFPTPSPRRVGTRPRCRRTRPCARPPPL